MARPRVHKQGTLDGLCGLYSLANAFNQLLHRDFHRHNLAEDTFREAAKGVPRRVYPAALWDGLEFDELIRSARHVSRWLEKNTGMGVDVRRPFKGRRFKRTRDYFAELDEAFKGRDGNAILSVDWGKTKGGGGHWTVYSQHDDAVVKVFDSDGPQSVQLRTFSVNGKRGDRILPNETILLVRSRCDGELL